MVEDVVAIQRGTGDPEPGGRSSPAISTAGSPTSMNATADAPGANDDGSGTAAVIEAARVLSQPPIPGDDRLCAR